ncbi:reverse transcriptase domain-containing protein [Tanacetum coccineum]
MGRPFLHTADAVIQVKQKQLNLGVRTKRMIFNINSVIKNSFSNDDTCFSIDLIDKILEEYFDDLLDEGSEILHSIEGTILKIKLFADFDEFMGMTADENSESESDTEEPPFEKITFNIDYKIKTSLEEPPTNLELKPLPDNLEYIFLEELSFLPVIIASQLSKENKNKFVYVLKKHKRAFAWKTTDIPRICPSFCTIYPIGDSPWVSPIHCVPKKGGITVVTNERNELALTRTVTGWRIPIDPMDQEKTTFTCPFGTCAYRRMPFGLCNAPATFQRCMLAIFHDMIEESVKVFMDDFSVFGSTFDRCLNNLDKMLQRCEDAHLVLNLEKCHFMVKKEIVLGYKVSEAGLEVNKAKINVISKLPPPTNIKEFDIEIKDRRGTENVTANHLSRIEKEETSDDSEVDDNFLGETLMEINTKDDPWFADFANYLEEPYLFKVCSDVAVDYPSKWAEAQALLAKDARVVITFLKKLFCHFRMPKALISDQGTHFCNKIIEKTRKRYRVNHRLSTSYHPQTSGQIENTNITLKIILEKTVKDNPAIWSRKLDDALWAFHTAYKTPTGTTPYKLIYGKNCHLPFEIEHRAYWALKNCNPDLIAGGENKCFNNTN